ncbi:heat-inducible transcriptional repressor HrcA [Angustibacter sp. McL0619]|uniref:heat-inducible transcriptional repressor HrcA n=1 Tax=Angustibacter sp. McL0619 TaxID=3415676 RepID=UPI003CF1FB8F
MSDERRLAVLRAIVEDYVETREPVGSKALVERHRLGVSSATIRNDMAALEDEGLITQPHTSAGRVPTDAGYRMFVDRLSAFKPMSGPERQAISGFLAGAVDLDDVVDRTVRLMASLTHQVAVMQYPSLTRSTVRHIELVPIGQQRLLVVLIAGTGRVEQRVLETENPLDESVLGEIRARINAESAGRQLTDAAARLQQLPEQLPVEDRELVRSVVRALDDALIEEREERVVLAGAANLTRFGQDFPDSIGPVLDALEEHVVLLRLLGELSHDPNAVAVRIGSELEYEGLQGTSVVSSGYGGGQDVVAALGVLGPTRMDYPTTMATVRAVARYVSRALDG